MGGFWAGSIPPWAYAAFACACLLFLCVGELDGMRRGAREAREDEFWAREQAKARRSRPICPETRERLKHLEIEQAAWLMEHADQLVPEVAHEAWLAHEEQALAIANETYSDGPSLVELDAYGGYRDEVAPDPRTDTQWTRDMAADMDAWLAALLGTHPITEELWTY